MEETNIQAESRYPIALHRFARSFLDQNIKFSLHFRVKIFGCQPGGPPPLSKQRPRDGATEKPEVGRQNWQKLGTKILFTWPLHMYESVAMGSGFQRTQRAAYHCSNFSMGSTGGKYR